MNHPIQTPSATYTFRLYPIGTKFKRIAGIYIFIIIPRHGELVEPPSADTLDPVAEALEAQDPVAEALDSVADALNPSADTHDPVAEALEAHYSLLYTGITNDFYARLQTHHKIQPAIALGMTHIGILRKSSGRTRKTIEKNILKHLNPPLNQTWLYDYSRV